MLRVGRWAMVFLLIWGPAPGTTIRVAGQDRSAEYAEAQRLVREIVRLANAGRYREAIPLAERVLTIEETVVGSEALDVAITLNNLASLYDKVGDSARAEALFQRALAIREKAPDAKPEDVAASLSKLASLYNGKRDYVRAALLYRRELAIWEKLHGAEHEKVAASLSKLASVYKASNDYAAAEPLYRRALAVEEKLHVAEHDHVGQVLNNLADLYDVKGDYERAEPLFQRALTIWEKVFGAEHEKVATALNNLAALYKAKGDYKRAEPLYRRALETREKALGPKHEDVAASVNNLATLYYNKGDYLRAEPLLQRALDIWVSVHGAEHEMAATALNNQAALYRTKGDSARAELLFKRALEIREKVLGRYDPRVATTLSNLGSLYKDQRDYVRAEPLLRRALEIREKTLGVDHTDVGTSLATLAALYRAKDDYERAEPLLKRALAIWEKALGGEHENVAAALNNLAQLYHVKRDYVRAEPLFQRALAILEKALGVEHPYVASSLNSLGALSLAKGEYTRAVQFQQRAEDIREHNLSLILTTGSEGQKQLYLNTLTGSTNGLMSMHAAYAPGDQHAARLAVTAILRRKGRALDAMSDQIAALRQRATPEDQLLLDQLASAQSQLAKLRLSGGDSIDTRTSEQRKADGERFTTEIESLQAEISRRSSEFRALAQPVTLEAVQQVVPAGAALIEMFSYVPVNMKATGSADRSGPRRYLAYVLKQKGAITFVDLGPTEAIERAADRFLDAISNPNSADAKETGRALDEMVARPIRKLLGDVRNVLISPDGKLNLVPFAALVDEQGKYLVEDYTITYLTSGRDLLRLNVPRQSKQAPVVIANPAFDLAITSAVPDTAATAAGNRAPASQSGQSADTGRRRSGNMRAGWTPLSGTAQEAKDLRALLPNARVLTGKAATEGSVKQVAAPRILHLATHGFFLPDQPPDPNDRVKTVGENPLLRSGLVLAGANTLQGGGDEDGVLTALEAAGLNLWGTQLVVLSACETGVGDVRSGEGVYGLRRALVLAGAESQMMTLWKVDDTATSEVIIEFYRRLQAGEGRTEALRQVQLEFLKRPAKQHPFFWASFILNGDWRSMRD